MPDPTEMILTGGFATALGIVVIFAIARVVFGRGRPAGMAAARVRLADAGIYQTPGGGVLPPRLPVGRVAVWFYRPVDLVGAGIVFMVFVVLALSSVDAPREAVPALGVSTLIINIGFQLVMAGAVAIFVVRRVGWVAWLGLRWRGWPWGFLIAPGAVVFMWLVFRGLKESGYMEWMETFGVETVQDTVKLLQQTEDLRILFLMSFAAVIIAPVCEELVFRGYFYPVLKKFAGAWPAAVGSALVFAGAHGNLAALLPLFIFGGVLVLLYEKTGSLWAPIAAHFCFNSATVIAQIVVRYCHLPLEGLP